MDAGSDYLTLTASLPRPTLEQTRAFVHHVAGAHSWYKHLPLFPPGGLFFFYLDPNAGRALERSPNGALIHRDLPEGESFFHYSTLPTGEYRRRFGFWSYGNAGYGSNFEVGSAAAGFRIIDSSLARVADLKGRWVEVPPGLIEAGSCRLTAFVHEYRPLTRGVKEWERQAQAFNTWLGERPEDDEARRYLPVMERVSEEFRESERAFLRGRMEAAMLNFLRRLT